jgi:hypothetical protein
VHEQHRRRGGVHGAGLQLPVPHHRHGVSASCFAPQLLTGKGERRWSGSLRRGRGSRGHICSLARAPLYSSDGVDGGGDSLSR